MGSGIELVKAYLFQEVEKIIKKIDGLELEQDIVREEARIEGKISMAFICDVITLEEYKKFREAVGFEEKYMLLKLKEN